MSESSIYSICKEYTSYVSIVYSPPRKSLCAIVAIDPKYLSQLSTRLSKFKYIVTEVAPSSSDRSIYVVTYTQYPNLKQSKSFTFEI